MLIGAKLPQGRRRARGRQPTGQRGEHPAAGWGAERCTAEPGAAPDLPDSPEKIKPGAGRVRGPPSSARGFTQRRKMGRICLNG